MLKLVFWAMYGVSCSSTLLFPMSISFSFFLVHIILLKMLSGYTLDIAIKLKGYTTDSQPCPFGETLVNASYMLAGQAKRITCNYYTTSLPLRPCD